MESPLDYDGQDEELKSQFNQLLSAIISINDNSSEEEIRALNERVQREVTAKPILGRIFQRNEGYASVCFLLHACITRQYEQFHPTKISNRSQSICSFMENRLSYETDPQHRWS